MKRNTFLVAVFALFFIGLAFQNGNAQTDSTPFSFRSGQSLYIVAYRRSFQPVVGTDTGVGGTYVNERALDVEQKVRKDFEKWQYFKVVDRISEADFIFLINADYSAWEGLAVSQESYNQDFKEKFDLDKLRDGAFGRCLAGPLKLNTLSRLSERLIKDFREKITKEKKS